MKRRNISIIIIGFFVLLIFSISCDPEIIDEDEMIPINIDSFPYNQPIGCGTPECTTEIFEQHISGTIYRECGDEIGVKQRLLFLEFNYSNGPFDSIQIETDELGKFQFSFETSKSRSIPAYVYQPNFLIALDDTVYFRIPSKIKDQELQLYLNDSIDLIFDFRLQSDDIAPLREFSLEFTNFHHSLYEMPSMALQGRILNDTIIHFPKSKLLVQNINADGSYRNELSLKFRKAQKHDYTKIEIPIDKKFCLMGADSISISIQ